MFQIGATATVAKRMNTSWMVDTSDIMQVHNHYSAYTSNLFRKILFGVPQVEYVYNESEFSYVEPPRQDNMKMVGHFQSERYLDRDLVLDLFNVDDVISPDIPFLQDILDSDSASIHVRRGDYVGLQDHHPVCGIDYYAAAIQTLGLNKRYFVFSDDIEWCKAVFHDDYTIVSGLSDWEEMYLMSKCKHHIIANSTFSWWGAWLNTHEYKNVIAPKQWFGPAKQLNTTDVLPKEWLQI